MGIISITKSHNLYPEMENLIIVVAALATSVEYHISGAVKYNPSDYATIEGLSSGKLIRLPLHGPIEAAIADKKPDRIDLTVEDISPSSKTYATNISALKKTIDYIFSPYFISFYERLLDKARHDFSTNYDIWPVSWRMGWVVRNAISHNGKVYYKNLSTPEVTWRGLTVSPANQDQPMLGNLLNTADLAILLIDMETDLI